MMGVMSLLIGILALCGFVVALFGILVTKDTDIAREVWKILGLFLIAAAIAFH